MMKDRVQKLLLFIYDNFAPLVVFYAAEHLISLRGAIVASVVFGIVDMAGRVLRQSSITKLYRFSFVTTLLFGAIDLNSTNPFIFKYESVVTNILTAGFFGITLFRGKPLIQDVAEKTMPPEKAARRDIQDYLKFLTFAWTGYFLIKAGLYAYVSYRYPFDEAMAFRSLFGTATLVIMLFGERLVRKSIYRFLSKMNWIAAKPL